MASRDRARTRNLRYHASIPLYFGDLPLGIMNVAAPAWRKLTRRELDLLSTIASQVGVAIERARLAGDSVHVARMEERTRLARELHDTLAQGLTAIGLHIEAALDSLPLDAPAVAPLRRALGLSRSSLDEARGSIRELRSAAALPLLAALTALARTFTSETGVRVHVRSTGEVALAPFEEAEVLRIAAEALTNVRRHPHATDVELTLTAGAGRMRLAIVDNGQGLGRLPDAGYGLVGMRERAQRLGGRLRVAGRDKRGTRVVLSMPLKNATP